MRRIMLVGFVLALVSAFVSTSFAKVPDTGTSGPQPSAQPASRSGGSQSGYSCGTRYTFKRKASQFSKKKGTTLIRRPGFTLQTNPSLDDSGQWTGLTGSIYLKPGYQICSVATASPPSYTSVPRTTGYPFYLKTNGTIKIVVGRTYVPHGSNCGHDAYQVVYQGRIGTGQTKVIRVKSTQLDAGLLRQSWSGSGLRFCKVRFVNSHGQVLWSSTKSGVGSHTLEYDRTEPHFLEITARRR